MPQKTPKTTKRPKSTNRDLGYAKQKDLLKFKEESKKRFDSLDGHFDLLAVKAIELDEKQTETNVRLTRVEDIVEKTYKMLDTHLQTQIHFDHELVAVRSNVDRHEERIVALEAKRL